MIRKQSHLFDALTVPAVPTVCCVGSVLIRLFGWEDGPAWTSIGVGTVGRTAVRVEGEAPGPIAPPPPPARWWT